MARVLQVELAPMARLDDRFQIVDTGDRVHPRHNYPYILPDESGRDLRIARAINMLAMGTSENREESQVLEFIQSDWDRYQELLKGKLLIAFTAGIVNQGYAITELIGLASPERYEQLTHNKLSSLMGIYFRSRGHAKKVASLLERGSNFLQTLEE